MSWIPPVIAAWEKVSSASRVLTWMYSKPYKKVLENEIELAKFNQDDHILNIGCGAVPFTALFLATLVGARVYALDIDPRAVRLASKCVEKAGLSHRIKVMQGDGAKKFHQPFTASIVALQASPKNIILEKMVTQAEPGARFVFRLPSFSFKDHYDRLLTDHPAQGVAIQPMKTFDRSVLYLKAA